MVFCQTGRRKSRFCWRSKCIKPNGPLSRTDFSCTQNRKNGILRRFMCAFVSNMVLLKRSRGRRCSQSIFWSSREFRFSHSTGPHTHSCLCDFTQAVGKSRWRGIKFTVVDAIIWRRKRKKKTNNECVKAVRKERLFSRKIVSNIRVAGRRGKTRLHVYYYYYSVHLVLQYAEFSTLTYERLHDSKPEGEKKRKR